MPTPSITLPLAEFKPDLPSLGSGDTSTVLNVVPDDVSYRPFPSFSEYADGALNGQCRGMFTTRTNVEDTEIFAGTANKLYRLNDTTWEDVTGTTVPSLSGDENWTFTQYGLRIIAAAPGTPPQSYIMGTSTVFEDLNTSDAPEAWYTATVRDFVFFAKTTAAPSTVYWSAVDNPTVYVGTASNLADSQILPDGGNVTGIVGGESALVFQEDAIRLFTFVGPPFIYQVDKISHSFGCTVPGSIATYQGTTFFAHRTGIYSINLRGEIAQVGKGKVDRYFWDTVDHNYFHRVVATIDPIRSLYVLAFPSSGNANIDKILIYHWPTRRWSLIQPGVDMDWVAASFYQANMDLDSAELAAFGNLDTLPFSLDSAVFKGLPSAYLSGVDAGHTFGFFNGANLAATVDTAEVSPFKGRPFKINGARPLIDTTSATLAIGTRSLQSSAVSYSSDVAQNAEGVCKMRSKTRYARFRMKVPASTSWTHFFGVADLENLSPAGYR